MALIVPSGTDTRAMSVAIRALRWDITEIPDISDWAAGHEHEPGILGRAAPARCLINRTASVIDPLGQAAVLTALPRRFRLRTSRATTAATTKVAPVG